MHIPDGYLSPSTCAALYAASTPFWYFSLRQIKKRLHSRMLPLLSVFAAFSFVVMMFNLPLPGGTTGHAVGMAMAAIILGPSMAIAAISLALLVQALLFGDGGITAYGANCFNMAIVGSLVSITVYKLASYGADLTAKRRVFAAGIAGYAGINVAALCAAIEFGIQPSLFHDASGTPLYAPYPLAISIPAMLIGHLTFAGLAEFVLSAGMIAYLQRTDPELLRTTAPNAPALVTTSQRNDNETTLPSLRKLWLALALALILTPLGIIAGGSAWGEWRAKDFSDPAARAQIARASGNQQLPQAAPAGMQSLAKLWQAPLSNYAPSFIRNTWFGYFVSASIGVGCIILLGLLRKPRKTVAGSSAPRKELTDSCPDSGRASAPFALLISRLKPRRGITFIERTISSFTRAADEAFFAEELARRPGLLQRLDVRAKMIGLGALVFAVIAVQHLNALALVLGLAALLALASRVPFRLLALRVWLPVLLFTGLIALPAMFLTPGEMLVRMPWPITVQGLRTASLLMLRAECAASLLFLLTVTTPWNHLLRALRWFRIPAAVVALLQVSYRYIFVLLETANNMFESRQTRLIGRMEPRIQRRFAAATAAVLLDKALETSNEVHGAMQARGFRGDIVILNDLRMDRLNWLYAAFFVVTGILMIYFGR